MAERFEMVTMSGPVRGRRVEILRNANVAEGIVATRFDHAAARLTTGEVERLLQQVQNV